MLQFFPSLGSSLLDVWWHELVGSLPLTIHSFEVASPQVFLSFSSSLSSSVTLSISQNICFIIIRIIRVKSLPYFFSIDLSSNPSDPFMSTKMSRKSVVHVRNWWETLIFDVLSFHGSMKCELVYKSRLDIRLLYSLIGQAINLH